MPPEPSSEDILLRFFRCMDPYEQTDLIQKALAILGKRCSLDRHYKTSSEKDPQEEIEEEDLDERLFRAWPLRLAQTGNSGIGQFR